MNDGIQYAITMRSFLLLFLISLTAINNLLAQDEEVYLVFETEPESDFTELRRAVKGDPITQIEQAFLRWDYQLLKPYLAKEIRKDCKLFFVTNNEHFIKHEWKKRTHYGPINTVIPDGNFGAVWEHNTLQLETPGHKADFSVDYSYYVRDSSLVIYALRSEQGPLKNRLDMNLKVWVSLDSYVQTLRQKLRDKNTSGIRDQLLKLESLKPALAKQPNFYESAYCYNMSVTYGNLSWYLIFERKYEDAIGAAKHGLALDESQTWIYTNLALSNLLAGHKDVALGIYDQYKNRNTDRDKPFRAAFLGDLSEAKKANLIDDALYNEVRLFLQR